MSSTFPARWPYTCACCGENQDAGTLSAYGDDGLLRCIEDDHAVGSIEWAEKFTDGPARANRAPDVMPRGKTVKDRCDRCFLIHSTGQTECY